MARAKREWETRAGQGKGPMGREMQGIARGVDRRALQGRFSKEYCDSASEVSHVACRPQTVCAPMHKASMSMCIFVHEGKSTKGTRVKGHFCAYPILEDAQRGLVPVLHRKMRRQAARVVGGAEAPRRQLLSGKSSSDLSEKCP